MIDDKDVKSGASCSDKDISQLTRDYREISFLSEKHDAGSKEELKEHLSKLSSDTGVSRAELLNSYQLEFSCNGHTEVIGRDSTKDSVELEYAEAEHLPSGEPVRDVHVDSYVSYEGLSSASRVTSPIPTFEMLRRELLGQNMGDLSSFDQPRFYRSEAQEVILNDKLIDRLSMRMAQIKVTEKLGLTGDQLSKIIKENPDYYKDEISIARGEIRDEARKALGVPPIGAHTIK